MDSFDSLSLDERRLIVGIDFGTTFSGIAWAETRRSDYQSVVETWAANIGTQEGTSSVKVPTQLRYTPEGVEWGFQIPPGVDRHKWFKLGLRSGRTSTVDGQSKSADDLITDYLRELVKHLMYTLEQKVGAAILRSIPLEFCLTVPAIWTEVEKEKTLAACKQAGLKSKAEIMLVSEPEAAAIYAIHGLDPHGLNIGDTFVLCDAGGGTVDLISYTITELRPILRVKEAATGTGGLCGSSFLNRRFGDFLTAKLGGEPGWDSVILEEAMEKFDAVIKKQYSPATSNREGYIILVPGLANNEALGIRRGRLTVTPAEMSSIFDPVINSIVQLVKDQIKTTSTRVKAVLLVGGFGQNNHLKEQLRSSLGSSVTVMQPPNAWTAVVRGAVMMGLARANPSRAVIGLDSRAARKHYGVNLENTFEDGKHDKSERFWSDRYGEYRCNRMVWLIKKGDPVRESHPMQIDFIQQELVNKGRPGKLKLSVYSDSQSPTAPVHKNSTVEKLVELKADFAYLEQEQLDKTIVSRKDGNLYYEISGTIDATFYSASTKYVLSCLGNKYDTVDAEYA